jgi:hypothetical protein
VTLLNDRHIQIGQPDVREMHSEEGAAEDAGAYMDIDQYYLENWGLERYSGYEASRSRYRCE